MRNRALSLIGAVLMWIAMIDSDLAGQGRAGGRGGQPRQTAQTGAPIELTGYWVSAVNEDWRWRMVTPPKGDYASVPLTAEGRRVADMWDESQDGSCRAYGVGGLMRMPTRVQMTWADPQTLQIQTDAGQQTRTIHFAAGDPGPRSLQGYSVGTWERPAPRGRGIAAAAGAGSLKVTTANVTGGWLRRNGVPYSQDAAITEYFDRFHEDQPERVPGPEPGDYAGLPISDAARFRAESWSASLLTLPEHQCKPHPSTYGFRGVGNLRIRTIIDEKTQAIVAYTTHIQWQEQRRTIWMDGRSHPPEYAAHTWQGFSTGEWDGNVLKVRTTHLKAGWIRRNGLPLTDKASMTELFIIHDDVMTHVYIVEDPVYLTEPLIKTNGFLRQTRDDMQPYPCDYVVEVVRPRGKVPHYLPGTNDASKEYADLHNLPVEAVRGGAETALPEFMLRFNPSRERGTGNAAKQ